MTSHASNVDNIIDQKYLLYLFYLAKSNLKCKLHMLQTVTALFCAKTVSIDCSYKLIFDAFIKIWPRNAVNSAPQPRAGFTYKPQIKRDDTLLRQSAATEKIADEVQ